MRSVLHRTHSVFKIFSCFKILNLRIGGIHFFPVCKGRNSVLFLKQHIKVALRFKADLFDDLADFQRGIFEKQARNGKFFIVYKFGKRTVVILFQNAGCLFRAHMQPFGKIAEVNIFMVVILQYGFNNGNVIDRRGIPPDRAF